MDHRAFALFFCVVTSAYSMLAAQPPSERAGAAPAAQDAEVIALDYARKSWGDVRLFDVETYYNFQDEPNVYAFTFQRGAENPPEKEAVLKTIGQQYEVVLRIEARIADVKASGAKEQEITARLKPLEWEHFRARLKQRGTASFCTVFCSAAGPRPQIVHAFARLPRHLVQLPAIEERIQRSPELAGLAPARVYYVDKMQQHYSLLPPSDKALGITALEGAARARSRIIGMNAGGIFPVQETGDSFQRESSPLDVQPEAPYTAIITHGLDLNGEPPEAWVFRMAQAIREDLVGGARVYDFNRATGRFVLNAAGSDPASPHAVLVMDWAEPSGGSEPGYSEASGDALFQALLYGAEQNDFSLGHLHFIGHSRGVVVNGEAVERLLYSGRPVVQVTTLDPHDYGLLGGWTDYDANPTLTQQGVVSWAGIQWADNYWQIDSGLFALSGMDLDGVHRVYLGDGFGHSEVHDWYEGTIDPDFAPDWYYGQDGRPARDVGGFGRARTIANGEAPPSESGSKTAVQFRFGDANQGIMNGDFRRDSVEHPGWHYFGGGGSGHIDAGHLELDAGDVARTHNYFYIPPEATAIRYLFRIYDQDAIGSPRDEFQFLIEGETAPLDAVTLDHETAAYETRTISLPTDGPHKRMTFQIVPGSGGVDSEVWLDNVEFVIADWPPAPPVPPAPAWAAATTGDPAKIRVTWEDVSGEDGYSVYRATSPSLTYTWAIDRAAGQTSWDDTSASFGVTYQYKVKSYVTHHSTNWRSAWYSPFATGTRPPPGIPLREGVLDWLSFNVELAASGASGVFGGLANLVIVQDGQGGVFIPPNVVFPGHPGSDTLSPVAVDRGYVLFIAGAGSQDLVVTGSAHADPTAICLNLNPSLLHWIPCPYQAPVAIADVFSAAATPALWPHLVIVQDETGGVLIPPNIVFFGHPGSNTIGDMLPGEGYKLFHSSASAISFCYPAASASPAPWMAVPSSPDRTVGAKHFAPLAATHKTQPIFFSRAMIDGTSLWPGDEIGVFDGEQCVGAIVVDALPSIEPLVVQLANEFPGGVTTGGREGQPMRFVAWDARRDVKYEMKVVEILSAWKSLSFQEAAVLTVGLQSAGDRLPTAARGKNNWSLYD